MRFPQQRLYKAWSDLAGMDASAESLQPKKRALFSFAAGSARSGDGMAKERKARVAASMGLRIMSEQAAHLAKQGSMIPHLYPERQLSKLPHTPPPLGVLSVIMGHSHSLLWKCSLLTWGRLHH